MSAIKESPTIQDVTALFEQDLGKCEVSAGIGIRRWSKRLWSCDNPAAHVVLFTCPGHGSRQVRVCRVCMKVLRTRPAVKCEVCHRRGKWKPSG